MLSKLPSPQTGVLRLGMCLAAAVTARMPIAIGSL